MDKRIRALLPHLRGRERLLIRLAFRRTGLDPRRLPEEEKEALEGLLEEGLVVRVENRVRLALEGREVSPTEALGQEYPHVRHLLLQAGKALPSLAHPLAREHPVLLVRAAEAALPYGRRGVPAFLLWLPRVAAWLETYGEEAAVNALEEAARKAREPFPYAERILSRTPAPKEKEDGPYLYI
ncbi:MAG: hypothetical protein ABDH20_01480 [Thermus sp.]